MTQLQLSKTHHMMILTILTASLSGCFGGDDSPGPARIGATLRYESEDTGERLDLSFGAPLKVRVDTLDCTAAPLFLDALEQREGEVLVEDASSNYFCLDRQAPMMSQSLWHQSDLDRNMTRIQQVNVGADELIVWLIAAHLWGTSGNELYSSHRPSVEGTITLEMTEGSTILTRDFTQHFNRGPPSSFQTTIQVSGPRGTIPDEIEKHAVSVHQDYDNKYVFEHDDVWELVDHEPGSGPIRAQGDPEPARETQRAPGPWPTTSGAGLPFQLEEARLILNASTDYQDYLLSHPEAFPIHAGYVAYEHPQADRRILIWHFILMDERDAFRVSCLRVSHNEYPIPIDEDYCEDGKEFQMGENYTTFQRPGAFRSIPDVLEAWRTEMGDPERDPTVLSWSLLRPPSAAYSGPEGEWASSGSVSLEVTSLPTQYNDTGAGPLYQVLPPATTSGISFGPKSGWNLTSGKWYTIVREDEPDLSGSMGEASARPDDDRLGPLKAPRIAAPRE